MKKLAVLGPKGTYSDIAARKYLNGNDEYEIEYYQSIIKAINSVDDNTLAIVPFENTLDGFVFEALDSIIAKKLNIISQIKLDIDFAFCANTDDINKVETVFSQFKAYGQCLDFINSHSFDVIKTESNIVSLNMLKDSGENFGAIVPIHAIKDDEFPLEILHIADSKENETRFFLVSKDKKEIAKKNNLEASVLISSIIDRPGILFDILKVFHDYNINLKSILSRPLKTKMGAYNFYLELSLKDIELESLYELVNNNNNNEDNITLLGIYEAIEWT